MGFEPTVRGKANSRFRVGPVMTTSVPLRAHIRFSVGTSVLLPLRGRRWDVLSRFALNTMRCRASLPPPPPLTRGRRTHGPRLGEQPISSRPRYDHFGTSPCYPSSEFLVRSSEESWFAVCLCLLAPDLLRMARHAPYMVHGGERGIRTLGPDFVGTHDFQSCPFNRSGISPHHLQKVTNYTTLSIFDRERGQLRSFRASLAKGFVSVTMLSLIQS